MTPIIEHTKASYDEYAMTMYTCPRTRISIVHVFRSPEYYYYWTRTSILKYVDKEEFIELSQNIFPDLRVAMLHGQMKSQEKQKIMADFSYCCNILKKFDEAITVLEKCLKINRELTISWGLLDHAYNEKGIELAKKGKFQQAYNMINDALKINPNFKNALLNLQEIKKVLHYQRQKLL
jgi:tetratricopeptide (TPR) repeat protein